MTGQSLLTLTNTLWATMTYLINICFIFYLTPAHEASRPIDERFFTIDNTVPLLSNFILLRSKPQSAARQETISYFENISDTFGDC